MPHHCSNIPQSNLHISQTCTSLGVATLPRLKEYPSSFSKYAGLPKLGRDGFPVKRIRHILEAVVLRPRFLVTDREPSLLHPFLDFPSARGSLPVVGFGPYHQISLRATPRMVSETCLLSQLDIRSHGCGPNMLSMIHVCVLKSTTDAPNPSGASPVSGTGVPG